MTSGQALAPNWPWLFNVSPKIDQEIAEGKLSKQQLLTTGDQVSSVWRL